MKTLSTYKREYNRAKTQKGKQSAFNRAMLNLPYTQREIFYKWQVNKMTINY